MMHRVLGHSRPRRGATEPASGLEMGSSITQQASEASEEYGESLKSPITLPDHEPGEPHGNDLAGLESLYPAYQPMGAGFQHQIFQQAGPEPQFQTFNQNGLGIQQHTYDHTGPGFYNPTYQQTGLGASYQANQESQQSQYGIQQPKDRNYGGQQFSSFEHSKNQFHDFVPGNIAHPPASKSSYFADRQASKQTASQSLNHNNGVPEQRRVFSALELNPQYPNQNLIQNLHQSLHRASQQPSNIVGQGNGIQQHDNPSTSASEQVEGRQNNLGLLNAANNLAALVNANIGISQSAANKATPSNSAHDSLMVRVETPQAPYSGVVPFKKPTPNTAPQLLGSETSTPDTPTPDFHSRRTQTVSRMKLDAARGPPTFWRGGRAPIAVPIKDSSRESSAVKPRSQVQPPGFVMGAGGIGCNDDPFTDRGYLAGPGPMPMTMTTARDVYQPEIFTQTGPIVPIAIGQQGGYGPSEHLAQICPNGAKPSIETALVQNNLPFIEIGRQSGPVFFGVLRISNIPYSTSRAEVIAFLGRNARIINENIEPVHIIMDRVSGKTEEVFVEFISLDEVINAVRRYENNRKADRGGLVGDRHVTLEVSSQEQLMERLFPRAKNVRWDGAQPVIMPPDPEDIYNSGFRGFVNLEEMVMLIKHVEHPSRTPFSRECPQRPFECLISTIVKYPWYMSSYITIGDRDIIYDGTLAIIKQLMHRVSSNSDHITLNTRLLRRLSHVALRCPGFTEMQKDNIAFICNMKDSGLAPYADHWHVLKVLGPRHGVATDVLLYYMALIREATTSPEYVSLAEQAAMAHHIPFGNVPCVFGNFRVQYPPNFKDYNMAQIAEIEWNAIDRVLRRILGSAQPTHYIMDVE